jgi:Uroporphyrinogen decarboxylase (URO-D)
MFTEGWDKLTPDERYEARMKAWFATEADIPFVSSAVREQWRERLQMLRDAIELKKPKRVPVMPMGGFFAAQYSGLSARDLYYDYPKAQEAYLKVNADFDFDGAYSTFAGVFPGEMYDILDLKLISWPGHGTGDHAPFQYNETEWMKADEYDLLLRDPSDFWQRVYLPRIFGALEPWGMLAPFTDIWEPPINVPTFFPFSLPPLQQMLEKLMRAGEAAGRWLMGPGAVDGQVAATWGRPGFFGGATKAPYDILGDTLRGTRGIMLDKFRRPEQVLAACERLVPLAIDQARRACDFTKCPIVFIPLHKGADGFLSNADFHTFYWPTLEAVLKGLAEDGLVAWLFAEGGYNSRLQAIKESGIPRARTVWLFDATDMREVRNHLGGFQCIAGNVPGALLITGSTQDVDDYVKTLISDVAGDGGYLLAPGVVTDEAKPECLRAMIEAGKKYGAEV